MLTKIRLLKIVLGFLSLALIGNLGIPWMPITEISIFLILIFTLTLSLV